MRSSRVSNSLLNWLATSCESHYALTFFAPHAFASCIPATRSSYSASLFDATKSSRKDYLITSSWGDTMCISTLDPCLEEASSTFKVQMSLSGLVSGMSRGNSTRKSARTCDFAQVLLGTRYHTHLVPLPIWSVSQTDLGYGGKFAVVVLSLRWRCVTGNKVSPS